MAGLLVRVAPFAASLEVQAEQMAAETAAILAEPGHPMRAAIPRFRAHTRETFEAAAAGCGFTVADLDTQVRVSSWRRVQAVAVRVARRLTRRTVPAEGGGAS